LSTWTIVWGKWLGMFSRVIWLSVLPTVLVLFAALGRDRVFGALVLPCLILSYGAALTSLGLYLATRIRQPGRAIAAVTTLHILMTVAWLFAVMMFRSHGPREESLMLGSSFYGPGDLTFEICQGSGSRPDDIVFGCVVWTGLYAGFAAFMLVLTRTTFFERRFGRGSRT
jgi:ABC-type transport system involved in multi-copper enzyme maturation permease subunit